MNVWKVRAAIAELICDVRLAGETAKNIVFHDAATARAYGLIEHETFGGCRVILNALCPPNKMFIVG